MCHKWQSYDVWFRRYGVWQNFLSYCTIFCPFTPLKTRKIKILPGDTIIFNKCIKNHDHMLYCSWDMACDRCNCYFSFWAIFCPFTPPINPTNQNFKTMKKKSLEISSFYTCVPNIIRWCTVPEIWCATDKQNQIIMIWMNFIFQLIGNYSTWNSWIVVKNFVLGKTGLGVRWLVWK